MLGTYIRILCTVIFHNYTIDTIPSVSMIILCEQASCISFNYYKNAAGASVVTVKL